MTNCKCAVTRGKGEPFAIENVTLDDPRENEVLIEIVGVGVCHTDMIVRDQYYPTPLPAVLGHEGAGIVRKVGSKVKKVAPGDHVVLAYGSCGECVSCLQGLAPYCQTFYENNFAGNRMDGSSPITDENGKPVTGFFFSQSSFGNIALALERNVVKIPKDVPLEIMGPLGCGITTGAGTVINGLHPHAGSSIAVFGAGSVGLSAIMAAKLVGCTTIIAIDLNESRLELAKELGATHVINGAKQDSVEVIRSLTDGLGAHYSMESTSIPAVFRQAVDCVRITGTCALVGGAPLGTEVALDMNNILFGRTVRGVIEGEGVSDIFIPQLIELWRQGKFPFDRLIKFYDFEQINEACDESHRGTVIKPVLRPKAA